MQPVTVSVNAVLDVISVNQVAVLLAQLGGLVPGGGFHLD